MDFFFTKWEFKAKSTFLRFQGKFDGYFIDHLALEQMHDVCLTFICQSCKVQTKDLLVLEKNFKTIMKNDQFYLNINTRIRWPQFANDHRKFYSLKGFGIKMLDALLIKNCCDVALLTSYDTNKILT